MGNGCKLSSAPMSKKARMAMHSKECDYRTLADRVCQGDREAGATLRQHLKPKMAYFVWHELRFGKGRTVIGKQIRAQVRRVAQSTFQDEWQSAEDFISAVAGGVCDWVLNELEASPTPLLAVL